MSTTSMEDVFKAGYEAGFNEAAKGIDFDDAKECYEKYRYDMLLKASGKEAADEWLAARKKPLESSLQNLKCPDCNGQMFPRSSQYGKFWGCANYPKCKGTRDSEGLSKRERLNQKDLDKEDKDINGLSDLNDVPVESGELYKFKKG